MEDVRKGT